MAGDWIKMRPSLLTSPKVHAIAKQIGANSVTSRSMTIDHDGPACHVLSRNALRYATVTGLLCVWGACNEHSSGGVLKNAELEDIDDIAGIPGFGDAMESVGWIVVDGDNLVFPNFDEYNTCGKDRSKQLAAERQRKYRQRKKSDVTGDGGSNVTGDVTRDGREEKRERREEDIPTPPPTDAGQREEIKSHQCVDSKWADLWSRWIDSWETRTEKRFDAFAAETQLMGLSQKPPSKAKADLIFSLERQAKSILDSDDDFSKQRSQGRGGKQKKEPVRL